MATSTRPVFLAYIILSRFLMSLFRGTAAVVTALFFTRMSARKAMIVAGFTAVSFGA